MSENIEKWLCGCGALLGFVENRTTIRIKRKDLYVEVCLPGKVTVICCRCGKRNELEDK